MSADEILRAGLIGLVCLAIGLECGHRIGRRAGEQLGETKGYHLAFNQWCWLYVNCPGGLTCHNDGTRGSVQIKKPLMVYHN